MTGLRIAVTGAAGFLGALLARELLAAEHVIVGGGPPRTVDELVILDAVAPPADLAGHPRVRVIEGDLAASAEQLGDVDVIAHLAGAVSSEAEADFDLGMRVNVDALRVLLEHGRSLPRAPVFVFTSSVAVFGDESQGNRPFAIDDETVPRPQSSYGMQKLVGELLVAEYARRGFVDGRSVRLMTTAVRPGRPNAAASSFVSGIVREPLAGLPANCPVPPATPIVIASPRNTIAGILMAISTDAQSWGSRTALTLPGLTVTPRDMVDALERVAGQRPRAWCRGRTTHGFGLSSRAGRARSPQNARRALGCGRTPDSTRCSRSTWPPARVPGSSPGQESSRTRRQVATPGRR